MQGLKNRIFFVEKQEAGDRLCSLNRDGDSHLIEEVTTAPGSTITALEPGVENVKRFDEIALYFLDDKGRLHKACRGKEEWIHTIQEIHAKPEQPLLSWSRVGVSRQAISIGQVTRSINTGHEVYKT